MKKIINGKKYDTETAKMLGETWEGARNDFNFWREELYKKRTGEFFIYGEGGANSRYSEYIPEANAYAGGEEIRPISEAEAKKWCETHLSVDEYEAIWGVVEE